MTKEREEWFNYYEDELEYGHEAEAQKAHKEYEMCKNLRNKLYHMNGRDTLAPGNHEQRWWDQRHDY